MKLPFLCSAALGLSLLLSPSLANAAEILSVGSASANFRDKPHEAAKIKFSADKFYPVEVKEKKNGWVKVRDFEGDEAWVSEKLLAKQPTVVITAERVNIREQANTKSDVLFKVERGEVFKIEERVGDWLKIVDARGDGGWIRSDMTWGDPEIEKKAIEAEKKDAEKESIKPEQAKESSVSEPKESNEPLASKLDDPHNLEVLCRAYLQTHDAKAAAAPKPEKKADKKAAKPEKADKKAAKPEKKADKKADAKPKKAEKKAEKKKSQRG